MSDIAVPPPPPPGAMPPAPSATRAQENVSMDAQVNVSQTQLTRDDELRLHALGFATKDRFPATSDTAGILADAQTYYDWLIAPRPSFDGAP